MLGCKSYSQPEEISEEMRKIREINQKCARTAVAGLQKVSNKICEENRGNV